MDDVLGYVTNKQVSEAMGISERAGYKVKVSKRERYNMIAIAVYVNEIPFTILKETVIFIKNLKKESDNGKSKSKRK